MNKQQKEELTNNIHKEYKECKEKYDNLHRMVVAWDAGVLPSALKPAEPLSMLKEQKSALGHYLYCLEKRMAFLKIDLPK